MSYSYTTSSPLDGCSCEREALGLTFKEMIAKASATQKGLATSVAAAQQAGLLPPVDISSGRAVAMPGSSAAAAAPGSGATTASGGFFSGKMPLYLGLAAVGVVGIVLLKRRKKH